jgi:hypothetical protein
MCDGGLKVCNGLVNRVWMFGCDCGTSSALYAAGRSLVEWYGSRKLRQRYLGEAQGQCIGAHYM